MLNSKGCSTSKHNVMPDMLRMALGFAVRSGAAFSQKSNQAELSPISKTKTTKTTKTTNVTPNKSFRA